MAANWKRQRGRDAQATLAKGGSTKRNDRIQKLVNAFRKNVWTHPDSNFAQLVTVNADLSLSEWKLRTPVHIVQGTMISFMRICTKKLTIERIESAKPGDRGAHYDMTQIRNPNLSASLLKSIFYTKATLKGYFSTAFNSVNRAVWKAQNEWKEQNAGQNVEAPAWVNGDDEGADIDVTNSRWQIVSAEVAVLLGLAGRVHGATKKKSAPLSPSEWILVMRTMYAQWYPEGFPANAKCVPVNATKSLIVQTKCCQAGMFVSRSVLHCKNNEFVPKLNNECHACTSN